MKKIILMSLAFLMVTQVTLLWAERSDECVGMVDKAISFYKENGPEYTKKVLCASKGPFIDKDLYVFMLNMDNVMLAHPWQRDLIGKNVDDYRDAKGNRLFHEFKTVVEASGAGWVEYWWQKPGEKEQFHKKTFVKRIPGTDFYVGAGYYTGQK